MGLQLRAPASVAGASLLLLAALTMAAPDVAGAQLAAGDTIRIWNARTRLAAGTFDRTDSAAVYLNPFDGGGTMRVAFTEFSRTQVLHGTRRGGGAYVAKGALIGAGAALALGGVGYLGAGDHAQHNEQLISDGGAVVLGTVLGMIVGTVIGGVAAVVPQDNWQDVDVRRARVTP